jgi:putative aldouronate transport system permease protein
LERATVGENQQPINQVQKKTALTVKRKKRITRFIPLFIMMAPGLLYFLINNYMPMLGMVLAFKEVNFAVGLFESEWVGFKNFEYLFKTGDAWIITRNTLAYNIVFIILTMITSIGLAILLNEIKNKVLVRFYQSVILIPHLISFVIISYLGYAFLSLDTGFMNHSILPALGAETVSWYMEPKYWPYILTSVNLWKGIGFNTLIFFAAVIGINEEYYEAAKLDGASKVQQIFKITIPLITPVIILLSLLAIGRIFYADFGLFYQVPMNSGALFDTTNVIDTYVFRGLLGLGDVSMATAAGVYQSLVGFILVLTANLIIRRVRKEDALF